MITVCNKDEISAKMKGPVCLPTLSMLTVTVALLEC
jgi:hypothetical protein